MYVGAIFNSVPEGTDPTKFDFAGSALVAVAETKEQVIEQLKEDIYYKEGVWDVDNVSIQFTSLQCKLTNSATGANLPLLERI